MKLPESITELLGKTNNTTAYYFSLILERDGVAVAAWSLGANNELDVVSSVQDMVLEDTWDARIKVIDRLLSIVEEKVRPKTSITKTVFGMSSAYLTSDGDIPSDIRIHLKNLSTVLELTPVGFVPITQAIAFSLKKDEGVPASVILVNGTKETITISLYRVGICVREETRVVKESAAFTLEEFLTELGDTDVLPSRILLYGQDTQVLTDIRGLFLKHQWTSKANFLHFPKIEVIPEEDVLRAVSRAGSAELTASIGELDTVTGDHQASTVVAQPTRFVETPQPESDDFKLNDEHREDLEDEVEEIDEESEPLIEQPMHVSSEDDEDDENIEVVAADRLGFGAQDVMEKTPHLQKKKSVFESLAFTLSSFSLPRMPQIKSVKLPHFSKFSVSQRNFGVISSVIGVLLIIGLLYYFVPRATVTVYVLPTSLSETATIIVDPSATIVDSTTKTIPGLTQELSLSSQKSFAVTGKKKVGDPAKGAVTFINKITSERILKKGAVLTAKGVSYSLDEEVKIASATSVLNSDSSTITFSKKDGTVTAIDIGPEGNVAAGTEFIVKDVSTSSVSGKNDAALSGGVSRDVTVVSRADYDGAVKALTDEIITKAKAQLLAEVGGNRLIEQTMTTKVTEKVFDKELDQEAKELSGNVTASVSGVVIKDEDIKSLLVSLIAPKMPAGYSLESGKTDVTVGAVQVKKDGKITVVATVTATALPIISMDNLQTELSGKSVTDALSHLKSLVGVAGAEFRFVLSPMHNRLPINKANITISLAVQ